MTPERKAQLRAAIKRYDPGEWTGALREALDALEEAEHGRDRLVAAAERARIVAKLRAHTTRDWHREAADLVERDSPARPAVCSRCGDSGYVFEDGMDWKCPGCVMSQNHLDR